MSIVEHSPALLVGIPLLAAFATPLISKASGKLRDIFVFLCLAFIFALAVVLISDVIQNGTRVYVMGGKLPSLTLPSGKTFPIRIILEPDAMSALMVLLTALIGLIGFLYSLQFIRAEGAPDKFYTLFMLLIAGMLGLEMTGDLFNFFVFFEITSIAACGLVGFRISEATSSVAAFRTMTIYTLSGLILLLGVGLLYGEYDALNIAYIASKLSFSGVDKLALALFIGALLMKIGSVPAHMWVPDAYGESPAPATIALVINTQAGLYGLLRVCFTLFGVSRAAHIGWLLAIIGTISILVGVLASIYQNDLKRLIAYTAVSQTGYMLMALGAGMAAKGELGFGRTALEGGVFHIFNDVISMGLVFLCAGMIYRATGIRDLNKLGGLAGKMRWIAVLFLIGGLAVAGLPPFNGFASKLMIYESVYKLNPIFSALALLCSIILLGVYVRLFYSIFLGSKLVEPQRIPKGMILASSLLALLIIGIGLLPGMVVKSLVSPAVGALMDKAGYIGKVIAGGM